MKELKIGIIGAGANSRLHHIPKLQAIEGVRVDIVCNRTLESSRRIAEEFGIPRVADDWESVVKDSELDAICIGTWPYLHAPITIAALANGKHVLTEARMAMNAAEAQSMCDEANRHPELVTQIVPSPFTLKWDATIQQILASGVLGTLREIEFEKSLSGNADSDSPLSWRQNIEYSGNNTLMLGIYYEVVSRWLKREPEAALAIGQVFTKVRNDPESGKNKTVEILDTVDVHARYSDGLRLVGRMTGLDHAASRDALYINGSEGSLRLDLNEGILYQTLKGGQEQVVEVAPQLESSWNVEVDFIDSIRTGKAVTLTHFDDGLKYMKFTDAVVRSARENGIWVAV